MRQLAFKVDYLHLRQPDGIGTQNTRTQVKQTNPTTYTPHYPLLALLLNLLLLSLKIDLKECFVQCKVGKATAVMYL